MRPGPAPTVVLVAPSRATLTRFTSALDGLAAVRGAPHAAGAAAWLGGHRVALVVVEVGRETADVAAESLRRLRDEHPHVPRCAYLDVAALGTDSLPSLFENGAGSVVFRGWDDAPAQLRRTFADAARHAPAQRVLDEIAPQVPRALRDMFVLGVERPDDCADVATVAATLAVPRRSLVRRFARAGAVPPRRFFSWCRILLAAAYLDDGVGSIERIAFEVALSGANALRLSFRRHLPGRFSDLRASGEALARARRAFLAELSHPADVGVTGSDSVHAPPATASRSRVEGRAIVAGRTVGLGADVGTDVGAPDAVTVDTVDTDRATPATGALADLGVRR
jgi:AraC-like DNA-binding protein